MNETFVDLGAVSGGVEEEEAKATGKTRDDDGEMLSFVVFGASGDLAKKKIYPALFALYYEGRLPKNFMIYGYARSSMTTEEFRNKIAESLTCRIDWSRAGEQRLRGKVGRILRAVRVRAGSIRSSEGLQGVGHVDVRK